MRSFGRSIDALLVGTSRDGASGNCWWMVRGLVGVDPPCRRVVSSWFECVRLDSLLHAARLCIYFCFIGLFFFPLAFSLSFHADLFFLSHVVMFLFCMPSMFAAVSCHIVASFLDHISGLP